MSITCFQMIFSPLMWLLQPCGLHRGDSAQSWSQSSFAFEWVSLPTVQWPHPWVQGPLQKTGRMKERRNSPLRVLLVTILTLFILICWLLSCLLCPFKIIECEGWLTLTTSVFWSWVRTPYQIVPCGLPAHGTDKNKGNCHHSKKLFL